MSMSTLCIWFKLNDIMIQTYYDTMIVLSDLFIIVFFYDYVLKLNF